MEDLQVLDCAGSGEGSGSAQRWRLALERALLTRNPLTDEAVQAMAEAGVALVGRHDFSAYAASGPQQGLLCALFIDLRLIPTDGNLSG